MTGLEALKSVQFVTVSGLSFTKGTASKLTLT
jgi:hypothetical protein